MTDQTADVAEKEEGVSRFFVFLCTLATLAVYYLTFYWWKPEKPDMFAFLFALIPPITIVVITLVVMLLLTAITFALKKIHVKVSYTDIVEPKRLLMFLLTVVYSTIVGTCHASFYSVIRLIQQRDWTFEHITSVMGLAIFPAGIITLFGAVITSGYTESPDAGLKKLSDGLEEYFGPGHSGLKWHLRFILIAMPIIVYADLPDIFSYFL